MGLVAYSFGLGIGSYTVQGRGNSGSIHGHTVVDQMSSIGEMGVDQVLQYQPLEFYEESNENDTGI